MKFTSGKRSCIGTASVCALMILCNSGIANAQDWMMSPNVGMEMTVVYNGPAVLTEINTNLNMTNFVGQPLGAFEFTILPNAGESYGAGEFEQIVFDVMMTAATSDMMPWVPPSIVNVTGETFSLLNAGQTLRYEFWADPIPALGEGQFRFQIERPADLLFDLRMTPIVPEPATLALGGLGALILLRRRAKAA